MDHHSEHRAQQADLKHYGRLLLMIVLSFVCMYILMYAMVNSGNNVVTNANQFYMAGLMTMPMVIIEVLLMRPMYKNRRLNTTIIVASLLVMIGFYAAIRQQVAINDKQFLKSMIPHHAGAILMCNEADIKDPEVKKLCEEIIASQTKEIDQMKLKLTEIKN
jgi:hypothetical protein